MGDLSAQERQRDVRASQVVREQGFCGYIVRPGVVCILDPHNGHGEPTQSQTDPTRAALVDAVLGIDDDNPGSLGPDLGINDDAAPALADAILAQPAMARIKAVVDAAVEETALERTYSGRGVELMDKLKAQATRRAAVDALLGEDSE